jgi:hypothetical protein
MVTHAVEDAPEIMPRNFRRQVSMGGQFLTQLEKPCQIKAPRLPRRDQEQDINGGTGKKRALSDPPGLQTVYP